MKFIKNRRFVGITMLFSVVSTLAFGSSAFAQGFAPSSNLELAFVDQSGNVYLKSGNINAGYTRIWDTSDPAQSVYVSQKGVAVLDVSGNLFLNSLPSIGTWTKIATGVTAGSYAVSNNSVDWLTNSTLYYKPLSKPMVQWSVVMNNVSNFKMAENGNVAATSNAVLYEAYGGYGAQWTPIATGFGSFDVSNTQVAAVFGGQLYVKMGLSGNWGQALSGAQNVQLSPAGNVASVDSNGNLDVTTNGYGSPWTADVRQAGDFESFYVSDSLISVVHANTLFVKSGGTTAGWMQVAGNVSQFSVG